MAAFRVMQPCGWIWAVMLGLAGCASGPHPALGLAKSDLKCDEKLTLHEIYPKKVRVEGCGKEATYVKGCDRYGADAKCEWAKLK